MSYAGLFLVILHDLNRTFATQAIYGELKFAALQVQRELSFGHM
jgi:hypothetical protein